MKVALLILGCAVRPPNLQLWLFSVVDVGLCATRYFLVIFAATSTALYCFDGLTCFRLNTSDSPFSYDSLISISRWTVDIVGHSGDSTYHPLKSSRTPT